jgi:hypothetical protein
VAGVKNALQGAESDNIVGVKRAVGGIDAGTPSKSEQTLREWLNELGG